MSTIPYTFIMKNDSFNKIKDINLNPLSLFSSNENSQKIKLKSTDITQKSKVYNDDGINILFNNLWLFSW